jgi:hypothetical protein
VVSAGDEFGHFTSNGLGPIGWHERVGVVDLDDACVSQDLRPTLGM